MDNKELILYYTPFIFTFSVYNTFFTEFSMIESVYYLECILHHQIQTNLTHTHTHTLILVQSITTTHKHHCARLHTHTHTPV